jgi:beta-galactosidase
MRVLPLFLLSALLSAQPGRLPTVLYGASYYHEYMPSERLAQDIELMRKAGLSVVRVGESTWSSWEPRDGILNPGYKLEWERFQQSRVTDFLAWQARIVNEYKRPGQFVTQDFSGGVHTDIDQWAIARHLDVVATNPYYSVQDKLDGHSATFTGDVARSLKGGNFLVTETNAQTTGWDSKSQFPPYDGQLRLNVYSHIADGANMVGYWHWHSLHYGQETYWKGVLSHDLQPNRLYTEFTRVAQELKKHGPRLANFQRANDVAILVSVDSFHGIQFMPFSDKVTYMTILQQFHKAAYQLNSGIDFVTPDSDYSRYKVLLVPPLYVASDAQLQRLSDFARNGGHVLLTFKSGFTDQYDTVRPVLAPGPLRQAAGFHYQEFSNLDKPLPLRGDPFNAGPANQVSTWAEMIIPENATPLAFYDHHFFSKYPAITRNAFGRGSVTFQGTVLTDTLQQKLLLDVLTKAGLSSPDQQLPPAVKVKHGRVAAKRLHYFLNYSGTSQRFSYACASGTDILSARPITKSQSLTLAPWDLAIIEEN